MSDLKEIRWKQRYENFNKAVLLLKEVVINFENLSMLEKEGMIQRFEYTFELAWKTLKDYLESKGISEKFPRDVIKTAFQNEIIINGIIWLEMLDDRNLLTHTYDEDTFKFIVKNITNKYFKEIELLRNFLHTQL